MMAMLIDPRIRAPTPGAFGAGNLAVEDDVFKALIRLCQETKLIRQIRHNVWLCFAGQIAINIDGTYPALLIWIMVRLTS